MSNFQNMSNVKKSNICTMEPSHSGQVVYSAVLVAWTVMGLSPSLNLHQCSQTHWQVHGSKRLSCHADLYTVSRCCTRGESEDHTGEKACRKGIHPGFETQGRHHQKSKTGVTVAPQKGLMSSKTSKKKHLDYGGESQKKIN